MFQIYFVTFTQPGMTSMRPTGNRADPEIALRHGGYHPRTITLPTPS